MTTNSTIGFTDDSRVHYISIRLLYKPTKQAQYLKLLKIYSPKSSLAVRVEPFVRKAAFLFLPERAALCLRTIFNFFVFDATFYLICNLTRADWSIKKEHPSQLSAAYSMNRLHLQYKRSAVQIEGRQSPILPLNSSF